MAACSAQCLVLSLHADSRVDRVCTRRAVCVLPLCRALKRSAILNAMIAPNEALILQALLLANTVAAVPRQLLIDALLLRDRGPDAGAQCTVPCVVTASATEFTELKVTAALAQNSPCDTALHFDSLDAGGWIQFEFEQPIKPRSTTMFVQTANDSRWEIQCASSADGPWRTIAVVQLTSTTQSTNIVRRAPACKLWRYLSISGASRERPWYRGVHWRV